MRYLQIQVKGYKSLADVTLDLHPLTVMIGPNGCGKTSLLQLFQFVKEMLQGQIEEALNNLGGLNNILSHTLEGHSTLEILLKVDVQSRRGPGPMIYGFTLKPVGIGYSVIRELLQWTPDPLAAQPYINFVSDRSSRHLSFLGSPILPPDAPRNVDPETVAITENQSLRAALVETLFFGPLDVTSRASIRLPQSLIPTTYPGSNGETLFAALYNLRESKDSHSIYNRIEETLQLGFPDFDHLELPVVGAGQITLTWYQKGLTIPLYPNQLSEGTLRFLWLTTVLLSPEPPPLILIDEPEVSLHPELLQILAALLRDASARTQLIVATHSSDLIRWLRPDEVVVIDKQDGKSTFTWADDPALDLAKWLQEYTLADLWYMGNLGGRP